MYFRCQQRLVLFIFIIHSAFMVIGCIIVVARLVTLSCRQRRQREPASWFTCCILCAEEHYLAHGTQKMIRMYVWYE